MKRVLSIMMIAVFLLLVFTMPASASVYGDVSEAEYIYYDRVIEYIHGYKPELYDEFHYYIDDNSTEPDWSLIVCQVMPEPWEVKYGALVGDRVLWTRAGSGLSMIRTGFTVYIPGTDTFIDLDNSTVYDIIAQCPNFVEEIEGNEFGQLLGDVDDDSSLDILDATYIQRLLAGYEDYTQTKSKQICTEIKVWSGSYGYFEISDFDRDGDTSILDATAIQRRLAKLDVPVATPDEV